LQKLEEMNKSWIKPILLRACALIAASTLIGLAFNNANPLGIRWEETKKGDPPPNDPVLNTDTDVSAGGSQVGGVNHDPSRHSQGDGAPPAVTWEEAALFLTSGDALLVDSRPRAAYRAGCIPGAVSLPAGGVQEEIPEFIKKYRLDTILIIYCDDSKCGSSTRAAKVLMSYGYEHVLDMPGGYAEWRQCMAERREPPEPEKQQ